MVKRIGRDESVKSLIFPLFFYIFVSLFIWIIIDPTTILFQNEIVFVIGLIAMWRYGWQMINYIRAGIYAYFVYPKLKQKIASLPKEKAFPKHIYFIIPSYKEESWVSVEVFKSLLSEISQIPSYATAIVSTGSDEEDVIIRKIYDAHPSKDKITLVFQRQSNGKRIALGHALRAVARKFNDNDFEENSITIMMDGDTYLSNGVLEKTIPFFAAFEDVGAVTTDEIAFINTKSSWYKDWFNLKFGQRHVLFQSHSLSKKVLTLTGRFSVYRTKIIVTEEFINLIENDIIFNSTHGKFRMLMGDDKSTLYFLLKEGWNIYYIPDALVYSLESRDAKFFALSQSLLYRWYGNTLRNNKRVLQLRKKLPLFIWYAVLDQRLSMWTSLVGIFGALLLSIFNSFIYLALYIAWVIVVRIFYMSVIALSGHPVSIRTIPLMLFGQWVGAYTKIKAYYNLADQNWKKGNSSQSSEVMHLNKPFAKILPNYMRYIMLILFIYLIAISNHSIMFPNLSFAFQHYKILNANEAYNSNFAKKIAPNDNKDDSLVINEIIKSSNLNIPLVIKLPRGDIDIFSPIVINRNNVTIIGNNSNLISHLKSPQKSIILVEGQIGNKIGKLTKNITDGDHSFSLEVKKNIILKRDDFLIIKQPNDREFLNKINSLVWAKKYPYLRQAIIKIKHIDGNNFNSEFVLNYNFDKQNSDVHLFKPIKNITLKNLILKNANSPKDNIAHKYENLYEDLKVNSITFHKTVNSNIENVKIYDSGSHPVELDTCYGIIANNLYIDGALNKGKKGNGYVRFSRTFHSRFTNSSIKAIRHITFQWSSANNVIDNVYTQVDINFHGGYSHHNLVKNIKFDIPIEHKWQKISTTPENASWASPDGDGNEVIEN